MVIHGLKGKQAKQSRAAFERNRTWECRISKRGEISIQLSWHRSNESITQTKKCDHFPSRLKYKKQDVRVVGMTLVIDDSSYRTDICYY